MAAGTQGLNAEFLRRFQALQAAARAAGTSIGIGSGWRSIDQQIALRKSNGCPDVWNSPASSCRVPTAIPGRSNHNHGLAIDITGDKAWANANAYRFGLHFPVPGENWHIEMIGAHDGQEAGPHMQAAQDQGAIGFDLNWAAQPGELQDSQDTMLKGYIDAMTSAHQAELDSAIATPMPTEVETPEIGLADTPVDTPTELRQDVQTIEGETFQRPSGEAQQEFHGTKTGGDRLANARIIAQVGRSMGANDQQIKIALAAALVESGLRNVNYGDRDSLGLFQQRPSQGWGTPQQVMDPNYAATQFFSRLLRLKGQYGSPGAQAQAVQRSAYPGRYDERWGEANNIFGQL